MKKTLKWNLAQKAELSLVAAPLKNKEVGAYHDWKRGYWQDLLAKISDACEVEDGMEVLDAGCGPAGIFMALSNCSVDAMDPLLDQYADELIISTRQIIPMCGSFTVRWKCRSPTGSMISCSA